MGHGMKHDLLKDFPVILTWPVAWGDMDSWGHVNNVAYLRYFESTRIAYFEKMKYLYTMETTETGPIVAAQSCRYRVPLYYPDTIYIGARITKIFTYGFLQEYRLVSKTNGQVSASGECRLTTINYKSGEKVAIEPDLKKVIETLEGKSFDTEIIPQG